MGDKKHRKPESPAADVLGASLAGVYLASQFAHGSAGEGVELLTSVLETAHSTGEHKPLGIAKGALGATSVLSGLAGMEAISTVTGSLGKGASVVKGATEALDASKDPSDRIVGGLTGVADGLKLGAKAGGQKGLFATGYGVGGASTLASSSATAALTAGGATSMAAAGAVLGAGVAGWGLGGVLHQAAESPHAQQRPGAVGGTHQSYASWWQDQGSQIGGPAGIAVGTTGATFGALADAGVATWNAVTGNSRRPSGSGGSGGSRGSPATKPSAAAKPAPRPTPAPRPSASAPSPRAETSRAATSRATQAQAQPARGSSAGSGGSRAAANAPPANPGGFWGSLRQAVGWGR